jgi:hypothetical protein
MSALRVLVDGEPLPDADARAFWKRFSEWMEEKRGDLAGFARSEGLASVHPELHESGPVLVASRTGAQVPYETAPTREGPSRHARTPDARGARAAPGSRAAGAPPATRAKKSPRRGRG